MMRITPDDIVIHACCRLTIRTLRLAAHDPEADVRQEARKTLQHLAAKALHVPPGAESLVDALTEELGDRQSPPKRPEASSYPLANLVRILQDRRQALPIPPPALKRSGRAAVTWLLESITPKGRSIGYKL